MRAWLPHFRLGRRPDMDLRLAEVCIEGFMPGMYRHLVVFPAITTARTFVVHASCQTALTDPASITLVQLSDSRFKGRSFMPITEYADLEGDSYYVGECRSVHVHRNGPSADHVFSGARQ
jgi:hypothetical protein